MTNILGFRDWWVLREDVVPSKQVITHLTHIEDLPFLKSTGGATEAYTMLKSLGALFAGNASSPVNLSVKIDGAPSIVVGRDPEDNAFFVATKGPSRIAKSQEDIDRLYGAKPGLHKIMSLAFGVLQDLSWPEILQGDVLFTPDIKQPRTIAGTAYITFKPNTITYAVPAQSPLGRQIVAASFGISFHTTYTGTSLKTLTARAGANVEPLDPPPSVVFVSNAYRDLSGTITFTKAETAAMQATLQQLQTLTQRLRSNRLVKLFATMPLLRDSLMQFQNQLVRQGKSITLTPQTFTQELFTFFDAQQAKVQAARSTDKGKAAVQEKFASLKRLLTDMTNEVVELLTWQQAVVDAKNDLLKKLNNTEMLTTFYDSDEGLVAGPHEGFVASDSAGNFVKLVDRSTFSQLNFTQGKFSTAD